MPEEVHGQINGPSLGRANSMQNLCIQTLIGNVYSMPHFRLRCPTISTCFITGKWLGVWVDQEKIDLDQSFLASETIH